MGEYAKARKKLSKPKLLPAGEYTCTVESLVGTKLTLNVNDLTLKDTVKLGLRLKIQEEPTLHPVGDFMAVIDSFGEPRESQTRENLYFIPVRTQTEHGVVIVFLGVFFSSLAFIKRMAPFMIGEEIKIRVKHHMYENRKYVSSYWL